MASRTAVAIRHVAFEDLDLLAPLLQARGFGLETWEAGLTDFAAADALSPDLLVVLGGPLGVYQQDAYPFIAPEIALVARRLERGLPTLGFCFGAQIMAAALGAPVYPGGRGSEIGWAPVTLSDAGAASPLAALDGPVLHWHGDTFDLPAGARHLARSALYEQQAFAVGAHALALQFHIEVSGPALERWFIGHAHEIASSETLTVPALRAETAQQAARAAASGRRALSRWLDEAGL